MYYITKAAINFKVNINESWNGVNFCGINNSKVKTYLNILET